MRLVMRMKPAQGKLNPALQKAWRCGAATSYPGHEPNTLESVAIESDSLVGKVRWKLLQRVTLLEYVE